jgi:hypothetical protein
VSDETREHSHATRDAAASAEHESRTHPRADVITAADLLAGAVMPMRLRLNVTVRRGTPEHPEHVQSATPRQPVSLDTRLSQHTAELLKWAESKSENAELLLTDPASAAEHAGLKLSAEDHHALKHRMDILQPGVVLPPGVELVDLKVNVAHERTHGRPADDVANKAGGRRE